MRPSEHASRSEAGGSEQGRREAQGRAHSPSPSFSGSYGFEDDDDDDPEDEGYARESDRGSLTERFAHEPTSASASSATAPLQKPKRTRQLTTPHQSAVLHALLAQSRFPTTAMREEVGRQIGLSARRVQVWFQNQRQKARKGSKDAAAAAVAAAPTRETGPPQFGPFTNMPPGSSAVPSSAFEESSSSGRARTARGGVGEPSTSVTYEHASGPSFTPFAPASEHYVQASAPSRRASEPSLDIYTVSGGTSFRRLSGDDLTGPGVPGSSATSDPFPQPSGLPSASSASYSRPFSPDRPLRLPPVHTITPPLPPLGRREGQTPESAIYQSEGFEQDPSPRSLRLPPIQLSPHGERRGSFDPDPDIQQGPFGSSHTSYITRTVHAGSVTLPLPRTPVAASVLSRSRGELSLSSMTPPPMPPPFTLEPNPVWQPSSGASVRTRAQSGPIAYATPSSSSSRQLPTGGETSMIERRTLPAPTRTLRFDPVRNTEIAPIQQPRRTYSRSPDDENQRKVN